MKHYDLHIRGTVQGVFFRDSARAKAMSLDVAGIVRNEPDGSVFIEAEGEESAMQEFIAWCHEGPPAASVDTVDVEEGEMIGYDDFTIVVL